MRFHVGGGALSIEVRGTSIHFAVEEPTTQFDSKSTSVTMTRQDWNRLMQAGELMLQQLELAEQMERQFRKEGRGNSDSIK